MQIIADLQLHSKYSRAVSKDMVIPKMYEWNLKKGIGLLATGDWTHPLWVRELKAHLQPRENGLLTLNDAAKKLVSFDAHKAHADPLFLLSGEVSCIYSHNGKTRRNHLLLFAPSFAVVDQINAEFVKRGCNLSSDGRPILGLTSQQVCEVVWGVSEDVLVIPAHAWTPWFSLFGSMSGYDSLAECFGSYADRIYAVETGLSSDPAMNWRIGELDKRTVISCSDSHSGPKLMREATIFETNGEVSYTAIVSAIKNWQLDTAKPSIAATVEFYPQEGKYHYNGHRNCNVRMDPAETAQKGLTCPACGKPMTIGVMQRVEELASRSQEELQLARKRLNDWPVWAHYSNAFPNRPPYVMMVPLAEIIAEALTTKSTSSKKVMDVYNRLVQQFAGEFTVLFRADRDEIARIAGSRVAEGVDKVRRGDIVIKPGYDGVFGTVAIWSGEEETEDADDQEQMSLF